MDFVSLGIALFANILIQLLTPPPEFAKPKKYGLSDFSLPTATEDRAVSLVYGTVPVAGNLIWSGDYFAREMTREVSTGLFSSATQTYGYKYHIGMWLSLCASTVDSIHGVLWGDKDAWEGNLTLSKTATTDLAVDFTYTSNEGQEVPDGITGTFRFFNQDWPEGGTGLTPLDNAYMRGQLGLATVPAYRGMCHAVFLGPSDSAIRLGHKTIPTKGFVGAGPNIPALMVIVKRLPAVMAILRRDLSQLFPLDGPVFTYPVTSSTPVGGVSTFVTNFVNSVADIEGDANPAFVIAELLCARMQYVGPRLAPHALDWDSIMRAAEILKNESHGVSFAWEESRSVGDVINDVCKQINAVLQLDERTGRLQLRLIRESDLPVHDFDSSNVVDFGELTRVQLAQAPSEVQVPYSDRDFRYDTRTMLAKNVALAQQLGTVVSRTSDYIGVSNARLASILASRELRSSAASLAQVRMTATMPLGKILKPGDVVTVQHPKSPVALRMRITSGRWNDYSARQQVEFECIEDVFRAGTIVYTNNPPVPVAPVYSTTAVSSPALMAAPYALTGDPQDRPLYTAKAVTGGSRQMRLTTCRNATGWSPLPALYSQTLATPAISGLLTADLTSYVTGATAAITLSAGALAAYNALGVRNECFAIAGSEWFTVATATLVGSTLTLTGLKRGIFDTVPRRHAAGAEVTLLLGYAIDETRMQTRLSETGPDQAGTASVACRVDTLGPGGTLFAEDIPSTQAVLMATTLGTSRAVAPLPPAYVRLNLSLGVGSPLDSPSGINRDTTTVDWRNRNRLSRLSDSYFVAANDNEPGAFAQYALDWEVTAGAGDYTTNSFTSAPAGATSAAISTLVIPSGARSVRLKIRSLRPSGNSNAQSATYDYFFRTTT